MSDIPLTNFLITWIDNMREPQCAPDPAYPLGIDIDFAKDVLTSCKVMLPYPARRCGVYIVTCKTCSYAGACTTAGRPDDPRSMRMPCKAHYATH